MTGFEPITFSTCVLWVTWGAALEGLVGTLEDSDGTEAAVCAA